MKQQINEMKELWSLRGYHFFFKYLIIRSRILKLEYFRCIYKIYLLFVALITIFPVKNQFEHLTAVAILISQVEEGF